jgi:predicted ATPase
MCCRAVGVVMAGVFISYRRADSAGWTGRIYDRLADRVGVERVFVDVEAIRPGEDFAEAIKQTLSDVGAVVVVMGPGWVDSSSDDGGRRLDDPLDVVRQEVAMALDRGVRVVPVLVDGARMPDARLLPEDIQALADRNAMSISSDRFDHDIERLLEAVDHGAISDLGRSPSSHNLPAPMTSFVGREEELASVLSLLEESRLVTLIGLGGVGKTRLALKSADQLRDGYEDGVWLVELAPISDSERVSTAVMDSLGLAESPGEDSLETLESWLAPREMLIVLDNCEHVIGSAADVVAQLLSTATDLTVLATSREVLGVPGEHVFQVGPLLSPHTATGAVESELMDYSAVRLFVERASVARPDWKLTSTNADAVVQVCTRLDGLPLAIELAAARLRMMPVEQIAKRLDERFHLLTGGSRTQLPRQQTLKAAIDWSFELLSNDEKKLFSRLAVFLGGFVLESAESVCGFGSIDSHDVMGLLGQLVDKSLVDTDQREEGTRYRMLETLREYAGEELAASGDSEKAHRRHAEYFLALAEQSSSRILGYEEEYWLRRLDDELDNMRQAMTWAVETPQPELAQQLIGSLLRYFNFRNRPTEGRDWAEQAIALSNEPSRGRAEALLAAGVFPLPGEDIAVAAEHLEQAIKLARDLGEHNTLRRALNGLAWIARSQGDWEQAQLLYQESAQLADRDHQIDTVFLSSIMGLVACAHAEGNYPQAVSLAHEGIEIAQGLGSELGLSAAQIVLVMLYRDSGDIDAAEEALRILKEDLAAPFDPGSGERLKALLAVDRGNIGEAVEWFRRRLTIRSDLPLSPGDLDLGAVLLAELGRPETAAVLMGAADAAWGEVGAVRWPKPEAEATELRNQLREHLGDTVFESAYEQGRGWDADERTDQLTSAINQLT